MRERRSRRITLRAVSASADIDFAEDIPLSLRALVLSHGELRCFMCGASAGDLDPYDPPDRIRLSVYRFIQERGPGRDEIENLRAICSVCAEGSKNISPKRPEWLDLLVQIRRAPALDQVEALKWLMNKFPTQAQKILSAMDG